MVSNYDRILGEITAEVDRIASENNLPTETLIELVMEIVDTEDRHRIKPIDVNIVIETLIQNAAKELSRE